MDIMAPVLYIIIPCYNEEKVLPVTAPLFLDKLDQLISKGKINSESKILFVDDCSKDNTWKFITELAAKSSKILGISQSKNRGHQNAVLAGLMESKDYCDITITVDCDGQDDINTIEEMVDEYSKGFEIVYAVRSSRDTDTFFKRFSAECFYKLMRILGTDVIFNHADYRLISHKVIEELKNFKEVNIFLRGMVPLLGFKSTKVFYERKERLAGKSHYPFFKMLALSIDGITSLSVKPIRIITALGFIISILSFIGVVWSVVVNLLGQTVAGWASTMCILCFVSGVQLISLGVIGEYIGKIYMEVKARPRYIIDGRVGSVFENRGNSNDIK